MARNTTVVQAAKGLDVDSAIKQLNQNNHYHAHDSVTVVVESPSRVPYALWVFYAGIALFFGALVYSGAALVVSFLPLPDIKLAAFGVLLGIGGAIYGGRKHLVVDVRNHSITLILGKECYDNGKEWWITQRFNAMVFTGPFGIFVEVPECAMQDNVKPGMLWGLTVQINKPDEVRDKDMLQSAVEELVDKVTQHTEAFGKTQAYGELRAAKGLSEHAVVQAVAKQIISGTRQSAIKVLGADSLEMSPPEDIRIAEERRELIDEIGRSIEEAQAPAAIQGIMLRIDNANILGAEVRKELRGRAEAKALTLAKAETKKLREQEGNVARARVQGVIDEYRAAAKEIEILKQIETQDPQGFAIFRFTKVIGAIEHQTRVGQAAVDKGVSVSFASVPAMAEIEGTPSGQRRLARPNPKNGAASDGRGSEVEARIEGLTQKFEAVQV